MDLHPARLIRRLFYATCALLVITFAPAPYAFADDGREPAPATTLCAPVAAAPSGIKKPTGSDAGTYAYNSCTGLWENQYYTWSPATQEATPKTPLIYSCDTAHWQWVTKVWTYDPAAGKFIRVQGTQPTLPVGALVAADSINPCAPPAPTTLAPTAGQDNAVASPTFQAGLTNTTTATMNNIVGSQAITGNAAVTNNTTAGDAASGNAKAMATVVNSVQSTSSLTNNGVVSFVTNVNGDVQGDLLIDPSLLQPASTSDALAPSGNITVNNQTTGAIHNNIDVAAQSGNATVADNTTAGNATTGNATAIANVVNLLNSVVSAGQSFIGVVNINGNLHGDILVPQSLIDNLVASNTPSTTVTLSAAQANSLGMTTATNQAITNNVTTTAISGDANVTDNTTAGNATTGNASTKVTIFNLTGSQIVGSNCLLVFVNVSGQWVGMIMNAPGATAAALGSGVTTNTANAELANSTTNSITNDINARATTGNAKVTDNTTAGNAQSGDASSVVNLLNMNSSDLSLTGWFGILFINVFGSWYGNFGAFSPVSNQTSNSAPAAAGNSSVSNEQPKAFRYAPVHMGVTTAPSIDNPTSPVEAQLVAATGAALAAATPSKPAAAQTAQHDRINAELLGGVLILSGIGMLVVEQVVGRHNARKMSA